MSRCSLALDARTVLPSVLQLAAAGNTRARGPAELHSKGTLSVPSRTYVLTGGRASGQQAHAAKATDAWPGCAPARLNIQLLDGSLAASVWAAGSAPGAAPERQILVAASVSLPLAGRAACGLHCLPAGCPAGHKAVRGSEVAELAGRAVARLAPQCHLLGAARSATSTTGILRLCLCGAQQTRARRSPPSSQRCTLPALLCGEDMPEKAAS